MTGPRQTRRIAAKARRLVQRAGYGERGPARKPSPKDYGPAATTACGKRSYTTRMAAEQHRDRLIDQGDNSGTLDVYECRPCEHYHVGHDLRRASNDGGQDG